MPQNLIANVFRQEVLDMSAYQVAEAKNLIKLDAMENPYSWPEDIKQTWLKKIKNCPLNRYPDPEARQLLAMIRQSDKIPAQSDILLGNGSDEIIQLLLMALPSNARVLAPTPSFAMYQQIAISLGLTYQGIPLKTAGFALDLAAILTAIEKTQPAIIFLAYPNNPTGNLFKENEIVEIIKKSTGLVVIDEAYAPFAEASLLDKLAQYNNLLVMRTVSKLGLAGLRLGFIVGHQAIIKQLNKIRLPYNINSLTQVTVEFALNNPSLFEQQTKQICTDRAIVFKQLNEFLGITPYHSSANFILFKTPENQANTIFAGLKKRGILIKNLSNQGGLLADSLRVTIGKTAENKQFIAALAEILQTTSA